MRWITAIALLVCLSIPENASAQRYYRGHRGGWDHGGRYYGGYYQGYYPSRTFGYSYYPWTTYSYTYPETYYTAPRTSYYYDPSLTTSVNEDGDARRARLEVIVPDANAEIYIQDQRMNVTGSVRQFYSPDLESGKTFTYTIVLKRNVAGRIVDETRKVDVKAGSRIVVDFTRPEITSTSADPLPLPRQR